ncbi:hypothetical protein Tco_0920733 [Tanacetum coccineum]
MGEPLSPDHVFDFPMDEPEPQYAYDFFAPELLLGYASNLNNTNRWIEADVPLLGELDEMGETLRAEVDEPMVDPMIDELAELIVKEVNEEWLMAPVTLPPMPVMPPPSTYKVRCLSTTAAEGHSLTLLAPEVHVSLSFIEDLCTCMGNLEYGHELLVKKVIMVSDAEVAVSIVIGEIGPRVSTVEDQM